MKHRVYSPNPSFRESEKNREYILRSVRCRGRPGGNLTFPEAQTPIDSIQIYDREKRFVLY